jgi:hypothetical protein
MWVHDPATVVVFADERMVTLAKTPRCLNVTHVTQPLRMSLILNALLILARDSGDVKVPKSPSQRLPG